MVGGAGTTVLGGTVNLAEAANTDGLAHVDVAGDGGSADVEPWESVNFASQLELIIEVRTSPGPGEGARWRRRS